MRKWKHTLDIQDSWEKAAQEEITPAQFAAKVVERLEAMPTIPDRDMQVSNFQDLAAEENTTFDDIDDTMDSLYDWADENSVWVTK